MGSPSTQLLLFSLAGRADDATPVVMQFIARACAVLGWLARGPLAICVVMQFTIGVFVLQKQDNSFCQKKSSVQFIWENNV